MTLIIYPLILSIAYLIGSIPSGLLISRAFQLEDPRKHGSKNIGATNVLRSGHKGAALLTFACDALKGGLGVGLTLFFAPSLASLACLIIVLGHIFPVWLNFKGGKGIATAFGAIFVLSWPVALLCLITWIAFFVATRYSSLASLTATLSTPLYAFVLGERALGKTSLILAILILWTHRANIGRLFKGEEHHIDNLTKPGSP
jgi:glycerol-3-phosphate acyltransferase PlsY